MHKHGVKPLIVHDELAKQAALDAGWSLTPVLNGQAINFDEAAPVEAVVDDAPKKRGRQKKDA